MIQADRLSEFLQKLTPLLRSCLLSELERPELCGIDIPSSSDIQAKLRAEFRGQTSSRVAYATSRIALPEPSSNAEWTEDAAFKAGDAILANPSLKAFCTRLRKLYGSDIPESGKLDVE